MFQYGSKRSWYNQSWLMPQAGGIPATARTLLPYDVGKTTMAHDLFCRRCWGWAVPNMPDVQHVTGTNTMFDTAKIIIASYPAGAGGKFLLNCIGLSCYAVLQDIDLALKQAQGNLTTQDKFNLLVSRINSSDECWSDLGLGCKQLFNVYYNSNVAADKLKNLTWIDRLEPIIKQQLAMPVVAHRQYALNNLKYIWPNHQNITFDNCAMFIERFRPNYCTSTDTIDAYWNSIRDMSWPSAAPYSLQDYHQLNPQIKSELESTFKNKLIKFINEYANSQMPCNPSAPIVWDCNWFFDIDHTVSNVQKVYDHLEFDDFNANLVSELYYTWFRKLNEIVDLKKQ